MKYKNLTISSKYLNNKNWNNGEFTNYHNHNITIYNTDTGKRCSFEFWNSNATGEITTESDLIGAFYCFVSDARIGEEDYYDFIHEFGYEENSGSRKIHKMCCKSLEQFNRVVDLDISDVLNDLQENYNC